MEGAEFFVHLNVTRCSGNEDDRWLRKELDNKGAKFFHERALDDCSLGMVGADCIAVNYHWNNRERRASSIVQAIRNVAIPFLFEWDTPEMRKTKIKELRSSLGHAV